MQAEQKKLFEKCCNQVIFVALFSAFFYNSTPLMMNRFLPIQQQLSSWPCVVPGIMLVVSGVVSAKLMWGNCVFQQPVEPSSICLSTLDCCALLFVGATGATLLACIRIVGSSNEPFAMERYSAFWLIVRLISAAVCEEIIFRKILTERMRQYSDVFAAVSMGIVFGCLHGGGLLHATFAGIVAGLLYVGTGKFYWPVLFHIFYNTVTALRISAYKVFLIDYPSLFTEQAVLIRYFGAFALALLFFATRKSLWQGLWAKIKAQKNEPIYRAFFGSTGMWLVLFLLGIVLFASIPSRF